MDGHQSQAGLLCQQGAWQPSRAWAPLGGAGRRQALPGIQRAGRGSVLQTLLEKGRFLLLAPQPSLCPELRVYFYLLNGRETSPVLWHAPGCCHVLDHRARQMPWKECVYRRGGFYSSESNAF